MFEDELKRLETEGLTRNIAFREGLRINGMITLNGRPVLDFGSNDYLGLSSHPEVLGAACSAVKDCGAGSGASRLLIGGSSIYIELEQATAEFKAAQNALILNSGYTANTSIIPVLAGEGDALYSDRLNHASIIDGVRLSKAERYIYPHSDPDALEALLKKGRRYKRKLVITDTVFSMEGDIARLAEISGLCEKYGALLYADEAHATGVLGQSGRGAFEHFGITPPPETLTMGTYSKALGSFGAFAAGRASTIKWIQNSARGFFYSTALPPASVAASLAALRILQTKKSHLENLRANISFLSKALTEKNLCQGSRETPIFFLRLNSSSEATRISGELFNNGYYAPAIRPPTVKEPGIRISISSQHGKESIKGFLSTLKALLGT